MSWQNWHNVHAAANPRRNSPHFVPSLPASTKSCPIASLFTDPPLQFHKSVVVWWPRRPPKLHTIHTPMVISSHFEMRQRSGVACRIPLAGRVPSNRKLTETSFKSYKNFKSTRTAVKHTFQLVRERVFCFTFFILTLCLFFF